MRISFPWAFIQRGVATRMISRKGPIPAPAASALPTGRKRSFLSRARKAPSAAPASCTLLGDWVAIVLISTHSTAASAATDRIGS